MTDQHDPRCERSTSDPSRCRCECKGRLHGVQAPGIAGEIARRRRDRRPLTIADINFLLAGGQQLAAHRDAALAEGVPL